ISFARWRRGGPTPDDAQVVHSQGLSRPGSVRHVLADRPLVADRSACLCGKYARAKQTLSVPEMTTPRRLGRPRGVSEPSEALPPSPPTPLTKGARGGSGEKARSRPLPEGGLKISHQASQGLALGDRDRAAQVVADLRRRVQTQALVDRREQVADRARLV